MPNLNKVMLMGNLTRDPELRKTPKGKFVTDVSLAINRYYMGDDGIRRDDITFVEVTLWGRLAEIVCQYCGKGRPLYVEGRLQLDTWEDRSTGQQRTRLKVVGENIQLLGGRDENPPQMPMGGYENDSSYPPQPDYSGSPSMGGYPGQQPYAPQPPPQYPPRQPSYAPPQTGYGSTPPYQSPPGNQPVRRPSPAPPPPMGSHEEEGEIPF